MNLLLILAILLIIVWVIFKVTLVVTGVFLHFFWIAAVIIFIIWLFGKLRGRK